MLVSHLIDNKKISRQLNHEVSLLTTDNRGGYLWISGGKSQSRYQGWFVNLKGSLYKILDDILVLNKNQEIIGIENILMTNSPDQTRHFLGINRQGGLKQNFWLHQTKTALLYKSSKASLLRIIFDIRGPYQYPKWERRYQIYQKNGALLVRYDDATIKKTPVFVALPLELIKSFKKTSSWQKKQGNFDEKRKSPPYELYVYHVLEVYASEIILGVGLTEKEAIDNTKPRQDFLLNHASKIPVKQNDIHQKSNFSFSLAKQALKELLIYDRKDNLMGLYAGLPWFFQFWTRDEAISLGGLWVISPKDAKELINLLIRSIKEDGRLPAIRRGFYEGSPIESADSIGWLFFQIKRGIEKKLIDDKDILAIRDLIEKVIGKLLVYHTDRNDGLAVNEGLETWMDTEEGGDNRAGKRIEIQCLRLFMYDFAYSLTGKDYYKELHGRLLKNVRKEFWQKGCLLDGVGDSTIRPNLFLAYYLYPCLLSQNQWLSCFDKALESLWLDWGGLSTIDRKSSLFNDCYSGEVPTSYHHGDSWFWINNIAALSMKRLSARKYQDFIQKIIKSSQEDILWHQALGHGSELSCASKFSPQASISQAWSMATYIELWLEN